MVLNGSSGQTMEDNFASWVNIRLGTLGLKSAFKTMSRLSEHLRLYQFVQMY